MVKISFTNEINGIMAYDFFFSQYKLCYVLVTKKNLLYVSVNLVFFDKFSAMDVGFDFFWMQTNCGKIMLDRIFFCCWLFVLEIFELTSFIDCCRFSINFVWWDKFFHKLMRLVKKVVSLFRCFCFCFNLIEWLIWWFSSR